MKLGIHNAKAGVAEREGKNGTSELRRIRNPLWVSRRTAPNISLRIIPKVMSVISEITKNATHAKRKSVHEVSFCRLTLSARNNRFKEKERIDGSSSFKTNLGHSNYIIKGRE